VDAVGRRGESMFELGGKLARPQPLDGVPARLWRKVVLAGHRLLMLDYDGTLAPFNAARDRALPLPRSVEFLKVIAADVGTTVAIVSGRPLAEIAHLLGSLPVTMVGEHGWEKRLPEGRVVKCPLSTQQRNVLDRAERLARQKGLGSHLERKRTGVVLHTRGLAPPAATAQEEEAISLWRPLTADGSSRLGRIHGGVELRLQGRDKGTAVLSLISQAPAGTLGVFLGDDATDEDAFAAVHEWGFGVRVGDSGRPSLAAAWLPSCAAVTAFLEEWLRVTGAGGARVAE
jgi:trehalose-phosphatase